MTTDKGGSSKIEQHSALHLTRRTEFSKGKDEHVLKNSVIKRHAHSVPVFIVVRWRCVIVFVRILRFTVYFTASS